MGYRERYDNYPCPEEQKHVHELQGSVKTADQDDPHQHRFCTVTGEAMSYGDHDHNHEHDHDHELDHVHDVVFRTDFFDGHYHEFCGRTGCGVMVGDRHVHFIESVTSVNDGHRHNFEAATLIENPTGMDHKKDDCDHHDHEHDHEDYNNRPRRNDFFRR